MTGFFNSLVSGLIDPGDWHPLRRCTDELNGFLQVPDCFIDFVVDNC